jgi:prophage DNA circulation protein
MNRENPTITRQIIAKWEKVISASSKKNARLIHIKVMLIRLKGTITLNVGTNQSRSARIQGQGMRILMSIPRCTARRTLQGGEEEACAATTATATKMMADITTMLEIMTRMVMGIHAGCPRQAEAVDKNTVRGTQWRLRVVRILAILAPILAPILTAGVICLSSFRS